MSSTALLKRYFPSLTDHAVYQFEQMGMLYSEWNARINLISRTDIVHLYERHILHSLAIARFINFRPGTRVMDLGTGGGFPGIPLAVYFPEVTFTLIDSIAKKIRVVEDVARQLELPNVIPLCSRAESVEGSFDYVVSRATAPLGTLYGWSKQRIAAQQRNAIPNGIIALKGGDLTEEIRPYRGRVEVVELADYFSEEFFLTKKLVFLACSAVD